MYKAIWWLTLHPLTLSFSLQVVEIGEDDGSGRGPKIGCSIKLVDQTSGEDMDPNGLRYKPRGSGPGDPGGRPQGLGASAGVVVGGKIDWGHLAGDNKMVAPGDHAGKYAMLEDDEKPRGRVAQQQLPPPPPLPMPPPPALGA